MKVISSRPIFIVGAPRSGTTLVQYMLRSHPNISVPTGESHFFIPLYRNAKDFGDLSEVSNVRAVLTEMHRRRAEFLETDLHGLKFDPDVLAEEFVAEGRATIPLIIEGLFEKNARGEGKCRWGDKTPYYVLHMPLLLEMFPDAQFIHLIRDGRDCALSMFAREDDFFVYNTYFAAKYWQQYVETGREIGATLGAARYHELRYEVLLEEPEDTLRSVCDFLREPFSNSLVEFQKSSDSGKTPLVQKSVQKSNKDKWQTGMTPLQIRLFESGAGDTLSRCGYSLVTTAKPLPKLIRGGFRLHNMMITRLRSPLRTV